METKQGRSRHQWRIDLEVRVFGGGPDQHDQPLFDGGQQRVLLGLVEPVHLVEEQDRSGAALAESVTSRRNLFPHVLHRRRDRRQLDEHLLGRRRDQTRQARLPGSGWAPEDHRRQSIALDQSPQRTPGGKQVALADHIVEVARPQPGRERRASRQALFGSGGEQVVSHRRDPILGDLQTAVSETQRSGRRRQDPNPEFLKVPVVDRRRGVGQRIGARLCLREAR